VVSESTKTLSYSLHVVSESTKTLSYSLHVVSESTKTLFYSLHVVSESTKTLSYSLHVVSESTNTQCNCKDSVYLFKSVVGEKCSIFGNSYGIKLFELYIVCQCNAYI
jgi:hypothetical protein